MIIFGGSHERGPARLRLCIDKLLSAPLVGDLGQTHVRHVKLGALHDEHEHGGAAVVRTRRVAPLSSTSWNATGLFSTEAWNNRVKSACMVRD